MGTDPPASSQPRAVLLPPPSCDCPFLEAVQIALGDSCFWTEKIREIPRDCLEIPSATQNVQESPSWPPGPGPQLPGADDQCRGSLSDSTRPASARLRAPHWGRAWQLWFEGCSELGLGSVGGGAGLAGSWRSHGQHPASRPAGPCQGPRLSLSSWCVPGSTESAATAVERAACQAITSLYMQRN